MYSEEIVYSKESASKCFVNRLSYEELSYIAGYLDHKDIQYFRRLNRATNIGGCLGILKNLEAFGK